MSIMLIPLISVVGLMTYSALSAVAYYVIEHVTGDELLACMSCWMWPISTPVLLAVYLTKRAMGKA